MGGGGGGHDDGGALGAGLGLGTAVAVLCYWLGGGSELGIALALILGFSAMLATWWLVGEYGAAPPATQTPPTPYRPPRPPIPRAVKQAVFDRDGGRCVQCESAHKIHFDHIIPFSKGGADTEENRQILCQSCNLRKGNRHL